MEEKAISIVQAIVIICAVVMLVGGFLVSYVLYFNRRKHTFDQEKREMETVFAHELLKTQFETREDALNQVGEELHDHIGQLLSSTKMLLGITERALPTTSDTLRVAQETLGQAIQDIRSLSKSLNREWLDQFDLVENLEVETTRINTGRSIQVHLFCPTRVLPLNAHTQIILFRIIQEALHNAVKHAEASKVIIEIYADGQLRICISDDGKGFDKEKAGSPGVGIINIRRRAKLIGGNVAIDSIPEKGTRVTIILPNQKEPL